jgi:hypothetical protein
MDGQIEVLSDGGESVGLEDVMFGEVWLCSGQSNMQFSVPQVRHAEALQRAVEGTSLGSFQRSTGQHAVQRASGGARPSPANFPVKSHQ